MPAKKSITKETKMAADDTTMRLNKYLAHAGIAARRKADNSQVFQNRVSAGLFTFNSSHSQNNPD
jgi:16S rRNA U516 pseudouridylate synthase RsuA-like enzyme